MIPSFIQSSFDAYKKDTNAVAIWLAATAKRYGYPADLLAPFSTKGQSGGSVASVRLKGKARKLAKASQTVDDAKGDNMVTNTTGPIYTIGVQDFITLAEFIASKRPAVVVPRDFIKAANRAIRLRHRSHGWYKKQSDEDQASDKTHSYFIGILEKTRELLRPYMVQAVNQTEDAKFQPSEVSTKDDPSHYGIKDRLGEGVDAGNVNTEDHLLRDDDVDDEIDVDNLTQSSNIFDGLEVYDPSEAFLDAPNIVADPRPESSKDSYKVKQPEDDLMEQYLALHCLFTDIRDIRRRIQNIWTNYQQGHLDLASASIASNTAIEFVRDLNEAFAQQFPTYSSCEKMQRLFFGTQCVHQGIDPLRSSEAEPFPFEAYALAEDVCLPAFILMNSLSDVLSPGCVPMYTQGHFGTRDTQTPWSAMSAAEKFLHDKLLLLELFPDLVILSQFLQGLPAEDELIRGIAKMRHGQEPSLWLAFAAQTFLDIHHITSDDPLRSFSSMHQGLTSVKATITMSRDSLRQCRVDNWPRGNDRALDEIIKDIDKWVVRDAIKDKMEKVRVPEYQLLPEHSLLQSYPLLCGLWLFHFKLRAQDVGLVFINAFGAIKYTGQLYHAARRSKYVTKAWPDMETAFALQGSEDFFIGNFPTSVEEDLRRFCLGMGYSATNFAPNRRSREPQVSSKGPQGLSPLSTLGHLFEGRYCRNEATVTWNGDTMEKTALSKEDDDSGDDAENGEPLASVKQPKAVKQARSGVLFKASKKAPNDGHNASKGLSITAFLERLIMGLHAEHLELSFDYLRLHRMCWIVLKAVNDKCIHPLREIFGPGYLEKENQLPWVVGYIFMTATSTERMAGMLPRRAGHQAPTSRIMALAGDTMQGFIESGAGAIGLKVLKDYHGLDMDISAMEHMTIQDGPGS